MLFMKVAVCALFVFGLALGPVASTEAATIPPKVVITTNNISAYLQDQALLRVYAEALVTNWTHMAWGDGIDYSWTRTVTYTNGSCSGAQNALDKMALAPLSFVAKTSHPYINEYAELQDSYGRALFTGGIGYYDVGGGSDLAFVFWVNVVPMLDRVSSASILAVGQDGVSTNYQLVVSNGQLLFPATYANAKNGWLEVFVTDRSWQTFPLSKPVQSPIISNMAGTYSIDGDISLDDTETKNWVLKGIFLSKKPNASVKLSHGRSVSIDLQGLRFDDIGNLVSERPTSVVATSKIGQVVTSKLNTNAVSSISLGAGEWSLLFTWKSYDTQTIMYVP